MTCAVSAAVREGAHAVICASTGNTAASAAAYAARAGLTGAVIVPEGKIATGKLAQALMHGARVIALRGNFDQALELVRELADRHPIALVNSVNRFRLEGQKTAAFELLESGRRTGRAVHPGGQRRQRHRLLEGLSGARGGARGCSASRPRARRRWCMVRRVEQPETVASAIRIGNPARWEEAMAAVVGSHGAIARGLRPRDPRRLPPAGRATRACSASRRRRLRWPACCATARATPAGWCACSPATASRTRRPRSTMPARSCPARPRWPPSSRRCWDDRDAAGAWCACRPRSANLGPGFDTLAAALAGAPGAGGGGDRDVRRRDRPRPSRATAATSSCARSSDLHPADASVRDPLRDPAVRRAGLERGGDRRRADGRRPPVRARRRPAGARRRARGPPDNVAAALLGGFVVCADGEADALRLPAGLEGVLVVPAEPVRTAEARAALPAQVPMADAVHNVAHARCWRSAWPAATGIWSARGLDDRLHQPHRAHLYPRSVELAERAPRARRARRDDLRRRPDRAGVEPLRADRAAWSAGLRREVTDDGRCCASRSRRRAPRCASCSRLWRARRSAPVCRAGSGAAAGASSAGARRQPRLAAWPIVSGRAWRGSPGGRRRPSPAASWAGGR